MTRDDALLWAIAKAGEIVKAEGVELALRARELDLTAIEAESTLLGAAIAKALIEAFDNGAASEE